MMYNSHLFTYYPQMAVGIMEELFTVDDSQRSLCMRRCIAVGYLNLIKMA